MRLVPSRPYRNGGGVAAAVIPPDKARPARRPSVACAFFGKLCLKLFHHGGRVDAGFLDVLGPLFLEWLRGLLPFGDLRGRRLIDLLPGLRPDLGNSGM